MDRPESEETWHRFTTTQGQTTLLDFVDSVCEKALSRRTELADEVQILAAVLFGFPLEA